MGFWFWFWTVFIAFVVFCIGALVGYLVADLLAYNALTYRDADHASELRRERERYAAMHGDLSSRCSQLCAEIGQIKQDCKTNHHVRVGSTYRRVSKVSQ